MLGHEAVILNWRLFWRSLRQSSGEIWIVIAVALLTAARMGESAVDLGEALASNQLPRDQAAVVLGRWLWPTFLAAFAYAVATGELSFIRSLLGDLALRPVSRWQAFIAAQTVWTVGPHVLALPSAGLPWLIVLATWLSGTRLLAAFAATVVMMRLPASLLLIGSRLVSASLPTAATTIVFLLAAIAALWLAVPEMVVAWSPPGLVLRVVLDGSTWSAWTGLAAWTLVVASAEHWSAWLEAAPRSAPVSLAIKTRPFPTAVALAARLGACPTVLLHGELLRLVRWRRYQLTLLAGAFFLAVLGLRMDEHSGPISVAFASLVSVSICGSVLANLFATDRAAVFGLLIAPSGIQAVMRAKVLAVLMFCVAGELIRAVFLLSRGVDWRLVAAGTMLAAGLFMWTTAIGLVTSVLCPSPSDPQTVGGALVNTTAFFVVSIGNGLFVGAAIGVAYMVEWQHWPWPTGGAGGLALVLAAAFAMRVASDLSPKLIAVRQEAMLSTLASPGAGA